MMGNDKRKPDCQRSGDLADHEARLKTLEAKAPTKGTEMPLTVFERLKAIHSLIGRLADRLSGHSDQIKEVVGLAQDVDERVSRLESAWVRNSESHDRFGRRFDALELEINRRRRDDAPVPMDVAPCAECQAPVETVPDGIAPLCASCASEGEPDDAPDVPPKPKGCQRCESKVPVVYEAGEWLCGDCAFENDQPADPTCSNCGRRRSAHYHEDQDYCYRGTNGDVFEDDAPTDCPTCGGAGVTIMPTGPREHRTIACPTCSTCSPHDAPADDVALPEWLEIIEGWLDKGGQETYCTLAWGRAGRPLVVSPIVVRAIAQAAKRAAPDDAPADDEQLAEPFTPDDPDGHNYGLCPTCTRPLPLGRCEHCNPDAPICDHPECKADDAPADVDVAEIIAVVDGQMATVVGPDTTWPTWLTATQLAALAQAAQQKDEYAKRLTKSGVERMKADEERDKWKGTHAALYKQYCDAYDYLRGVGVAVPLGSNHGTTLALAKIVVEGLTQERDAANARARQAVTDRDDANARALKAIMDRGAARVKAENEMAGAVADKLTAQDYERAANAKARKAEAERDEANAKADTTWKTYCAFRTDLADLLDTTVAEMGDPLDLIKSMRVQIGILRDERDRAKAGIKTLRGHVDDWKARHAESEAFLALALGDVLARLNVDLAEEKSN